MDFWDWVFDAGGWPAGLESPARLGASDLFSPRSRHWRRDAHRWIFPRYWERKSNNFVVRLGYSGGWNRKDGNSERCCNRLRPATDDPTGWSRRDYVVQLRRRLPRNQAAPR